MVENDTFTYSMRKSANTQAHAADYSLITQERTQKLELLIHLIANLTQTLVICGPQGIGKTTLLRVLHERKLDSWTYCLIQGNADLSFEAIQEQLNRAAMQGKHGNPLQDAGQYQSKGKKTVLLIDDAGALVPGLITTIMQYAWTNPVLRVVFALTHDELHVKNRTDRIVDDCHFVEIPPLSEKQCGDFLQQLSTKPWARLSLNAINDSMIRNVYRHTHGIPGRIIAEIPGLAGSQKGINSLWALLAAVAALIAVALGVQWYSSGKNNALETAAPVAVEERAVVSSAPPAPSALPVRPDVPVIKQPEQAVQASEPILDQYIAGDIAKPVKPETTLGSENKPLPATDTAGPNPDIKDNEALVDTGQKPVLPPALEAQPADSIAVPEAKEIAATDTPTEGDAWLSVQPPGNFTLQVMLLSKEQSIKDFLKKYPSLAQDLKYTKTVINGKERFLLLYGSFSSSASASKAKQGLPREFGHSLVKKISAYKK